MTFALSPEDEITSELIEEKCENYECCLELSDLFTDKSSVIDKKRRWYLNTAQAENKSDENIRLSSCASEDILSPPIVAESKEVLKSLNETLNEVLNQTSTLVSNQIILIKQALNLTLKNPEIVSPSQNTESLLVERLKMNNATKVIDCKVSKQLKILKIIK